MIRPKTLFLVISLAATLAVGAQASPAQWKDSLRFKVNAGPENPLVLFGFNPQPEPPADALIDGIVAPDMATVSIANVTDGQFFSAADWRRAVRVRRRAGRARHR